MGRPCHTLCSRKLSAAFRSSRAAGSLELMIVENFSFIEASVCISYCGTFAAIVGFAAIVRKTDMGRLLEVFSSTGSTRSKVFASWNGAGGASSPEGRNDASLDGTIEISRLPVRSSYRK